VSEALFRAIQSRDLAAVHEALARGAAPNATRVYRTAVDRDLYEGTESALMLAAIAGAPAMVRALLAAGASPDLADELTRRTALIEAAARGQAEIVDALLEAGADLEARDAWSNENALTAAVSAGNLSIARRLLEAGTPMEPRALDEAVRIGRADLAELLVDAGLDPNATAALATAAICGRADMVRWLAARGVDLVVKGPGALHNAANAGAVAALEALLELGVPLEGRTSYGWSALHLAAYNGDVDTVRALLEAGADPSADDGTGKTPLDWARERPKPDNAAVLQAALASRRTGGEG
jgi:ankyrin repeat protein